jgi:lysyl-tRNA synthetase class 2
MEFFMDLNENDLQSSKEIDIRKNKIKELKQMGINPYAPKFDVTHSIIQARQLNDSDATTIAGRMVFRRVFGKFMFVQIQDVYAKIQVSLSVNQIALDDYNFFKNYVDIGDFVGFSGIIYHTQTNELTVQANSFKLLSKAMLPLPEKYHGLTDMDTRYRQRYLDLIANDEVKDVFIKRSKIISFIRNYLIKNDFLEVETPVLQSVASGAAARPFITKHNALDKTLYLRIAPELFLKQVIAGGVPRVFEIGKNYRNEGMDAQHLQEFTMLEWYASFWDYNKNIEFITKLIKDTVYEVCGSYKINYQGVDIDFGKEWGKVDYIKSLNDLLGVNILDYDDVSVLKKVVNKLNIFDKAEINEIEA